MKPAAKPKGFKFWEYILCYVDEIVFLVHHDPMPTMKLIQSKFKFKNDEIEEPDVYLGATFERGNSTAQKKIYPTFMLKCKDYVRM